MTRTTVKVDGKTVYAGETIYSVDRALISFHLFEFVWRCRAWHRGSRRGDRIAFQGEMRESPASATEPIDATWMVTSDGYGSCGPTARRT